MKYRLYMFDFDGTLANTLPGAVAAYRKLEKKYHLPAFSDEQAKTIIGPPTTLAVKMVYPDVDDNFAIELSRNFDAFYNDTCVETFLYDGILDIIKTIRAHGGIVAVDTAKYKDQTYKLLEQLGVMPYLDCVSAWTYENNTKQLLMKNVLTETGCRPEETIAIGDSIFDAEAATKVGVDLLAVTYGYGFLTREAAEKVNPAAIAENIAELQQIITGYLQ